MQINECWVDIKGYLGVYQISNLGNVKSLERVVVKCNGREQYVPEKIMKLSENKGYKTVSLSINGKLKTYQVHKLVAIAFLNHSPDKTHKLVINHINEIKTDNRVNNLEIVTQKDNVVKYFNKNSKGYSWNKKVNKWHSQIKIDGKNIFLGQFETECEAKNISNLAKQNRDKFNEYKTPKEFRNFLNKLI